MIDDKHLRSLLIAIAVSGACFSVTSVPVAAQDSPRPAFVVDLHEDGSATVTVTFTFDLTTETEREAFQALAGDEAIRDDLRTRFRDRIRTVAGDAQNATGREMTVGDASVELSSMASTGVMALSVDWSGLAARTDGRLVVTEPFTSGFSVDQPFVVRAPDGYTIVTAAPAPAERNATRVEWDAETNLDRFEVVIEADTARSDTLSTESPTVEDNTESIDPAPTHSPGQPGFGPAAMALAVLVAVTLAATRGA